MYLQSYPSCQRKKIQKFKLNSIWYSSTIEKPLYRGSTANSNIINNNCTVLIFYLGERMLYLWQTDRNNKILILPSHMFPKCCFQQEQNSNFKLQGIVCLYITWYFNRWFDGLHYYQFLSLSFWVVWNSDGMLKPFLMSLLVNDLVMS